MFVRITFIAFIATVLGVAAPAASAVDAAPATHGARVGAAPGKHVKKQVATNGAQDSASAASSAEAASSASVARAAATFNIAPDTVPKGETPTLTITLDQSIPEARRREIKAVRVGGQAVDVSPPLKDGKVFVIPPKLEVEGTVDVEVLGNDSEPLAAGKITYGNPNNESSGRNAWALVRAIGCCAAPDCHALRYVACIQRAELCD